jgi:hypothetical protein
MKPTTLVAAICGAMLTASLAGAGPAGADPESVLLTREDINAVVAQQAPQTPPFAISDPVRRQPDNPPADLQQPCGQVLPLYFGGGEPRFDEYASAWTAGAGNTFVSQLVARYASAAAAATKFAQLSQEIPVCAEALTRDPNATLALSVDHITADSAHFEQRQAGANSSLPNRHDVAVQYQLVGASIIGVSSSLPAAMVNALAGELRGRVGE